MHFLSAGPMIAEGTTKERSPFVTETIDKLFLRDLSVGNIQHVSRG